jgi:predicted metal-dependent phosphoesterase TrpH
MPLARAAAHVHSDWSYDGNWPLPALATALRRCRYDAVLMTDHDRTFDADRWDAYREECGRASDGILLVPGIEYSNAENSVHVLVWGANAFFGPGLPTAELVTRARESGGVTVLAHPRFKDAWRRLDEPTLASLDGVEWWNRRYDGIAPSPLAVSVLRHRATVPFVGLDFHMRRQFFPLGMRLGVDGVLDVDSVFAALRQHKFQATAFGVPVTRVVHEPALSGLRAADLAKQKGHGLARWVKREVSRMRP